MEEINQVDKELSEDRQRTAIEGILSAEQLEEITAYLQKEVQDAKNNNGRLERIERNNTIEKQRQIRPENKEKNFPWDGAANTVPPLAWTKISSVAAKRAQAILNKDPIFGYESTDKNFQDNADAVTRHIKTIVDDPNQSAFRSNIWPLEFDGASFGTAFVKVPFEIETRYFSRKAAGGGVEEVEQRVRSCPKPYIIPFEDFVTRYHWWDIQKAPWCGTITRLFWHELKSKEYEGYYTNVELIQDQNSPADDEKVNRMAQMGTEESYTNEDANKIFDIYEIYLYYDAKKNGKPEDFIIHYEPETSTILRVEYNDLGRRDLVRLPYAAISGLLYGMGVGDMVSSLQTMIEDVFNTSFNSDMLSYMGMIVTRTGSGLAFGKDVYPGAVFEVPDPQGDVNRFEFPSVTPQAMMLEQKIQGYADLATGATSMMVGQEGKSEGNRIGSTGTQFLASKGDAYLEAFLEQSVIGYQQIGELILLQLVRNSELIDYSNVPPEDIPLLKEVYETNVEEIGSKFRFKVSMSSIQQETRERQEALMTLFELYNVFTTKITEITIAMSNPELSQPGLERLQEVLMTTFVGFNKLFKKMLINFDEEETGDYLPSFEDMEYVLSIADKQKEEELSAAKTQQNTASTGVSGQGMAQPGSGGSPNVVERPGEEGVQGVPGGEEEAEVGGFSEFD